MRKLIFVWFLISVSLLFVIASVAVFWNGPVILQAAARYFASEIVSFAAESGLSAYEKEGIPGLDRFMNRVNFRGHTVVRILDGQGRELKQRPLPWQLESLAKRDLPFNEVSFERTWLGSTAAYRLRSAAGNEYRLLFYFPVSDVLGDLVSLPGWFFRIFVFLLIVVGMCSWLAAHLTAPLAELQSVARRFANSDLKARVGDRFKTSVPEIRELALGFDDMAFRMEHLVDRQQRLLQQLSHELRTPLTRLGLSVNMARGVAGEAATPALNRIEQEAERLNALIERILRLSRLETSLDLAPLEPIAIGDFLETIVADAQFEASARGRSVRLLRCEGGRLEGDRDLLRGAFENVLRNAIRYSPQGTEIEVSQSILDGKSVQVLIRDHGPGVPESQLQAMFEPFVRISQDKQPTDNKGFGLGLTIVRRSLELDGGTVSARNAEGGGLEVRMLLPLPGHPLTATLH
jgi:two-component system, OmpR family, sensor histidine kinase CpxA